MRPALVAIRRLVVSNGPVAMRQCRCACFRQGGARDSGSAGKGLHDHHNGKEQRAK
jgi:hypothetical protein